MAKFTFTAAKPTTTPSGKAKSDAPQAYIFIGRDKFRSDERTPQEWRKLFVCLARMAQSGGAEVSQNEFGLAIVYDALTEMEAAAKKALKEDYDAAIARHWAAAQSEDKVRAEQSAKRAAERMKADEQDTEQALAASVKTRK